MNYREFVPIVYVLSCLFALCTIPVMGEGTFNIITAYEKNCSILKSMSPYVDTCSMYITIVYNYYI